MSALDQVGGWPAARAAVGVVRDGGVAETFGERSEGYAWASVTKLATAYACLVAAEEGTIELEEPAGPPGSTVRHLLAHASGLPLEGGAPIAAPGTRRIYSNAAYGVLGEHLAVRAEMPFAEYLAQAVLEPLGMRGAELAGDPGAGLSGSLDDLLALALELVGPRLVAEETLAEATSVQFAGLVGVLPGFGRQEPNDWGLGFELRNGKHPHWTGTRNSPRTFGHFGQAGTFLWIDPDAGVALACLTDERFGEWAQAAWPRLADAVLEG